MLQGMLHDWGYEVEAVDDGLRAWEVLQRPDAPRLALLDWVMPGLDGTEVCRKARAAQASEPTYIILFTGRGAKENIVAGLESGASDYVAKPFDRAELRARL